MQGVAPIGTVKIRDLGGKREIPLYTMDNFLNTPEGWKLQGECLKTGDMEPYEAARAAYIIGQIARL